ncbi:MAG: hypothetical protein AB7S48_09465 [Bacteroidales bacterium]
MVKNKEKGYRIAVSNGTDGSTLVLSGDLSLNSIKSIKEDLAANLNNNNNLKIVVKDAENIDLGILQLLQSYAWRTLKSNKQVDVEFNLTADQQKLLSNAGIKLKF